MMTTTTPEEEARKFIDEQLTRAGWHVCDRDAIDLVNQFGNAVREVIMKPDHGRADYEALAAAAEIAGRSPSAVRGAKQLINRLSNAGAAEHFAAEREIIFTLIGKPHQVEAITANFENRAPVFKDVG